MDALKDSVGLSHSRDILQPQLDDVCLALRERGLVTAIAWGSVWTIDSYILISILWFLCLLLISDMLAVMGYALGFSSQCCHQAYG